LIKFGGHSLITEQYALDRIRNEFPRYAPFLERGLKYFERNSKFVTHSLPIVPDVKTLRIEPGCHYEQLAFWNDKTGKIEVSLPVYNKLKNGFHRGALGIHETFYYLYRIFNASLNLPIEGKSDQIRLLVAQVFSLNNVIDFDLVPIGMRYDFINLENGKIDIVGPGGLFTSKDERRYESESAHTVFYIPTKSGCAQKARYNLTITSPKKKLLVRVNSVSGPELPNIRLSKNIPFEINNAPVFESTQSARCWGRSVHYSSANIFLPDKTKTSLYITLENVDCGDIVHGYIHDLPTSGTIRFVDYVGQYFEEGERLFLRYMTPPYLE